MKSAAYFEDGQFQLILTPENEFEKHILAQAFAATKDGATVARMGGFYQCVGGWTRHSAGEDSLMIVGNKGE